MALNVPSLLRAPRWRCLVDYAALSVWFACTRVVLYAAGFPFSRSFSWMFLADPEELRTRLVESVLYFHAYPPGMNLLTGGFLKLSEGGFDVLARAFFAGCGLAMIWALYYLARAVGAGRALALSACAAFAVFPPTLFFENLYLYTYPVACLLTVAAALLCVALRKQSGWAWFSFFLSCALLGVLRSTFHLSWFVLMLGLSLVAAPHKNRRAILLAAGLPALLLLALYAKNYLLFDHFGATSAGGGNLTHVTVMRMPPEERRAWVERGKLSPIANISVYAPPRAYLPYFGSSESERWPKNSALDKPSIQAPNYNHWFFMKANELRSRDAMVYLKEHPTEYLRTVGEALQQFFGPSTRWHPTDRPRNGALDAKRARLSPHYPQRQLIGGYEQAVNTLLHRFPFSPVGVYVLLPFVIGVAAISVGRARRAGDRARAALLAFAIVQVLFVATVSSLFTIGESSRYRYQVEPLVWLLVIACVPALRAGLQLGWRRLWDSEECSTT